MDRKKGRKVLHSLMYLCLPVIVASCSPTANTNIRKQVGSQFSTLLKHTDIEYVVTATQGEKKFFPRSTNGDGNVSFIASNDWCSGFFPGCLWLMSELTADTCWQSSATKYTRLLENEQWNDGTHDTGFKIMCSYGNGLRITGDTSYKRIIIQSARTLITRFNDTVGCIRSWDHHAERWSFPVIIDNMMNLELLFKATELTGDSIFYKIAVKHANTTLKNHFRKDNSSYHVVDYDPRTGKIHEKVTFQGDADESAWARGQAWGLYGYTMCYRFTQDTIYLKQAQKIAHFIMNHPNLPLDKIPMWDFDYNEKSGESRDVSAATIIASALFELSDYSTSEQKHFRELANTMLNVLKTNYMLHNGNKYGFLLDHSVGFRHLNHEVNVPLIYADYYFLEALLRQKK